MSAPAPNDLLQRIRAEEFRRSFAIDTRALDVDARTVELSFSSEAEVDRWYGVEVLDHSANVRMDRLRNLAPLLLNHNANQQIGVVESARIDAGDKKGRAVVRFSRGQLGEEIFQDVQDGIRGLVSVGYRIHKVEIEERGKEEFCRVVDWEPFEISIVSIPADTSVGVGRNAAQLTLAQETANRINQKENIPCDSSNPSPIDSSVRTLVLKVALPPHLTIRPR